MFDSRIANPAGRRFAVRGVDPRRCAGAGLLSSLVIIIVAAAITAGAVVGLFWWEQASQQTMTPAQIEALLNEQQEQQELAIAPQFELIDAQGDRFDSSQLRGKIWIADFGFTRCRGICPAMTSAMRDVIETLQMMPYWEDVHIVRFSVDPEHDTPRVLRQYLAEQGIDELQWHWLTGDKQKIWNLSERGFKLPVEEAPENEAMPVSHSSKFVLVTPDGKIFGYYNALDDQERMRMLVDVEDLINQYNLQ